MDEKRITKRCWKEKQRDKEKDTQFRVKEKYLGSLGLSNKAVEGCMERKWDTRKKVVRRESDFQRQGKMGKIKRSIYGSNYKEVAGCGRPRFLQRGYQGKDFKTIASITKRP